MSIDLDHQLQSYGTWIEARHDIALRPESIGDAGRPADAVDVVLAGSVGETRPRRWLSAAVAVFAVVALGATAMSLRDVVGSGPSTRPSVSAVDPPGALYVLPDLDRFDVGNARVEALSYDDDADRVPGAAAIVGRPDGDGYVDVISVYTASEIDVGFGDFSARPDFEQPTVSWITGDLVWMVQDRGFWKLSVRAGALDDEVVADMLRSLVVADDGSMSFADGPFEVVETASGDVSVALVQVPSTRFDVTTSDGVWAGGVTTFASTGGFVGFGTERIERVAFDGVDVWHVTGTWGDGYIWQMTPHRTVLVGAENEYDETTPIADPVIVRELAESMYQVDGDVWTAAVPGAEVECTLDDRSACPTLVDD